MKVLVIISVLLGLSPAILAQHHLVGKVMSPDGPLYGATVILLSPTDSTMQYFGLSNEEGRFELYDLSPSKYVFQLSYTGYRDSFINIEIKADKVLDMGVLLIRPSTEILEEVKVVAERIPMGIKGDTINYNAAAFKTKKGASVEELLKKLPGIEVARDGSIKAQGKKVKNVMVDGKEFFSGSPTMATKNLEAESVDKVQVFDKKSEEAQFTGIDDGQEEKTINLKLKEGYKNGGFGKMAAMGGTSSRYLGKLNYNRFSPSLRASILSNMNNINQEAFSFNEYIQLMGGFSNVMANGGLKNGGFFRNGEEQKGITEQKSVGSNFNFDPSKNTSINLNYLYAGRKVDRASQLYAHEYTGDILFESEEQLDEQNRDNNHKIYLLAKHQFSPLQKLSLKINALGSNQRVESNRAINYINQDTVTDASKTLLASTGADLTGSIALSYHRKFEKKGRNWKGKLELQKKRQNEELNLDFLQGLTPAEKRYRQKQDLLNTHWSEAGNLTYTEPLGKGYYINLDYSNFHEQERPNRMFYDLNQGVYVKSDSLSAKFDKVWDTHELKLSIRRNRKMLSIKSALGIKRGDLAVQNSSSSPNQIYLLPYLNVSRKFKHSKRVELTYSTQLKSPKLNELFSVANNRNPDAIYLGNDRLQAEYSHHLYMSYNSFDQFNFSSFFSNVQLEYSKNKIVYSRRVKEDFRSELLPMHSPQYLALGTYLSQSSPIRPLRVKYTIELSSQITQYINQVNQEQNQVNSGNTRIDFRLENRNKSKVDIAAGVVYNIGNYHNSLATSLNQVYTNYSLYTEGIIDITKQLQLDFSYDIRRYQGSTILGRDRIHLLNAALSYALLDAKLRLKLTAHDLLNQDQGISRAGGANNFVEEQYQVLGQFFMLGLSYKIARVKNE